MPRPPAPHIDNIVDADVCARNGSSVARHFSAADLPRVAEAGGSEASAIDASFQFGQFEGRPTVAGTVQGTAVLTCQRCMRAVSIGLDERFRVVIVDEEGDQEPGGFEPIVANAARLDLRWLAEEQVLLALPLVPMHEGPNCTEQERSEPEGPDVSKVADSSESSAGDAEVRQRPFQNLRDMLRQR